jgi:hypothetical protein
MPNLSKEDFTRNLFEFLGVLSVRRSFYTVVREVGGVETSAGSEEAKFLNQKEIEITPQRLP